MVEAESEEDADEDDAEPGEEWEVIQGREVLWYEPCPEEPWEIHGHGRQQIDAGHDADRAEEERGHPQLDERVCQDDGNADAV